MGFQTKVFGTIYKRIRTGSFVFVAGNFPPTTDVYAGNVLTSSWVDRDYPGDDDPLLVPNASTRYVSSSFLNFPQDYPDDPFPRIHVTTRNSSNNAGYNAIPWGSMACDFLWNVKTPRWSVDPTQSNWFYDDGTEPLPQGGVVNSNAWRVSLENTQSFFKQHGNSVTEVEFGPTGPSVSYGVNSYDITSSWYVWDAKFLNHEKFNIPTELIVSAMGTGLPGAIEFTSSFVGFPIGTAQTDSVNDISYNITWPNSSSTGATSSIDGQYFDRGGGAAITRALVSESMRVMQISSSGTDSTSIRNFNEALKKRRLFYPTPVSGSGVTRTDYWHQRLTGFTAADMFDENGGIYNVQFTLKRHIPSDHAPDPGSFMNVFIHDVAAKDLGPKRVVGRPGWYPPTNNIVTIGNGFKGSPILNFYDSQTGYLYERFNINLVQYGYPAQLCFEPSGSLIDNSYFGIIIDDISICKIGVTSDPRFIKP